MSNRRLTPNQSKTNHRRLADQARTILAATLLSGGILSSGMIAWANSPAPGTVIENQATGSFVDPSNNSTNLIESNVVQVTVAEVAGITVTNNGFTEPNDGTVNAGDTVYFDFVITNVGNDPTQFVIPGSASITNGTQAGDIQIIAYDADGSGAGAAVDLSGSNITVPGGGDTTGNLLNGVANTNNGSVPADGSITVRVPITAGTSGFDLTVTLGDTAVVDGQNEAYVAGTNDIYTQDNAGTTNSDTDGAPINNEREASDSLTVAISASSLNISGTVYDDDNLNNVFDTTEPKMPAGITIRLLNSDGSIEVATTTTDANGDYSFLDVAPGTYQIQLETTDPDILVGYFLGTPNPLMVTVSSSNLTDNDFGFDNPRAGTGFSPFCVNTYGEVYVGQGNPGGNRIYAIQGDSGAVTTLTNNALATPNSLATDYLTRTVYYAESDGIYAWDAINDVHQRLLDINGNNNARTMPGSTVNSLSSGGAAFYDGSLYVGSDPGSSGVMEIYRVNFAPGSDGKTIQSITALGINGPSVANGALSNGDWGDFIIGDNGVIYASSGGSVRFWSYDLNTGTYQDLVDSFNTSSQLAKDGQGRLFALPNAGASATTIIQIEIVGNTIQTVGTSSSISPALGFDAAECVIGRSSIGDRVWDDLDGDSIQDPLEPGIANVTVGLYRDVDGDGVLDAGDPLLGTQLTNSNGNYDFVDLIFGNYIVKVLEGTPDDLDGTNLVDGAVITTANSPGGEDPVTLPTGIVDFNDADFGYQLPIVPKDPNVLLVKRITQINNSTASAGGDDLAGYINQDDVTNPYDDNDITVADPVNPTDPPKDTNQWPDPTTNLIGGIDGGNVMPNDEIEYTIYYLSSGDATAENVLFCDYVPTFTSFMPNGYSGSTPQATGGIGGADLSIELLRNGATNYHTGANDGDSATYFAPGNDPATSFPGIDCDGDGDGINANTNGAVVVNLGDLPDATANAAGAYGYVRFRTRVK